MFRTAVYIRGIEIVFIFIISLLFSACESKSPEVEKYENEINRIREEKNKEMKNDPGSPFNQDPKTEFKPLKYYDPSINFAFTSKLYKYPVKDTIIVYGTKGEARTAIRFGYVIFKFDGQVFKIKVYKSSSKSGEEYFSIWFTDKTTGDDTYGVGRYLDFEYNPDPDYLYKIDFNLAYNPYCAYSSKYSCGVPTKEDYIDLAITAGEKNFH